MGIYFEKTVRETDCLIGKNLDMVNITDSGL